MVALDPKSGATTSYEVVFEEVEESYEYGTDEYAKHTRDVTPGQGKEVDEASMTGTGASFNAGSGEGYMTPYAFKKKKKK